MLTKELAVELVGNTFPGKKIPPRLIAPATINIDMRAALLMLGSVSIPSGFSAASPARFWAWIRYFSAIATHPDLRIIGPFVDLDPHQKTILSDDFGVAICTRWLHDTLGGFRKIVDGRLFLLQYASLIHRPHRKKTPKVGPGKCPDFVVLDRLGKWHILECKGTQTSLNYRNRQLVRAVLQKKVIRVTGSIRGERLAAGLFVGNDRKIDASHLRVIDPEVDPYVSIDKKRNQMADVAARRVMTSRALGLAGFVGLSGELSVPAEKDEEMTKLYSPGELLRFKMPAEERLTKALTEMKAEPEARFEERSRKYLGREVTLEIPGEAFRENTGFHRITVRQGVDAEFVDRVHSIQKDPVENIDEISDLFLQPNDGISVQSDGARTTLSDGRLFIATMDFH